MGGQENAEVALMGDLLNVPKKLFRPTWVNSVVDLLDDEDRFLRNREESRRHGEHAEGAVREKGCLPRHRLSPERLMKLDHDLASGRFEITDITYVLLRKGADELENSRFCPFLFSELVEHRGKC